MNKVGVGIGEILWDMLPTGKQIGGAPANFIYYFQKLSEKPSTIVSSIGNDDFGQEIRTHLKQLRLNKDYLAVDTIHPTGRVLVEMDAERNHSFRIEENVAWDFIHETPALKKLAENTGVVCFGTLAQRSPISRNTIQSFLRNISSSAMRIFDINLRQSFYSKEIIETSLNLSNIFKINEQELAVVSGLLAIPGNEVAVLKGLAERFNLSLIILTRGGKGSLLYLKDEKNFFSHPGFRINVVDSVGAGDAFTASVAVGILKNYDFDYINDCANRVAAFVCSQAGAMAQLTDDLKGLFNR